MNAALTGQRQFADFEIPLRRANYDLLQQGLVAGSYEGDRFAILKPACATDKQVLEARKAAWVQFYINALALEIDLDTIADINDCELIGTELV